MEPLTIAKWLEFLKTFPRPCRAIAELTHRITAPIHHMGWDVLSSFAALLSVLGELENLERRFRDRDLVKGH